MSAKFRRSSAPELVAEAAVWSRLLPAIRRRIDQDTSPLGRNLHLRLVRAKKLVGRRIGKKVLVHREEMNRFIVSFAATKAMDPEDQIDRELRALDLPMRVTTARKGGKRPA